MNPTEPKSQTPLTEHQVASRMFSELLSTVSETWRPTFEELVSLIKDKRSLELKLQEANETINTQHRLMVTAEKRGVDKATEEYKIKLQEAKRALAIEKRHWIEDDRDLNELIDERDQAIRERDEAKKLKSILPIHGCLTGDCPHDNANQCVEALKEYVAQMEQAELELQAEREQLIEVVDAYAVAWFGYKVFPSLANERQFADADTAYSLLPHVVQAKKGNQDKGKK